MLRWSRMSCSAALAVLVFSTAALAQDNAGSPTPSAVPAAVGAPTGEADAASATAAAEPGVPAAAKAVRDPSEPIYGVAARWRYIMVPGWFLGFFTQKNVPLYTPASFGLEGFRRKIDKDDPMRSWELVVGVGYQDMSPPDGYWLGKGKNIAVDTDLVQARNLSLITMDAAFVSRQYFNPYFGIHYGAGLGLGIVRGKILRTSAQYDPNTKGFEVRTPGGSGPGYGTGQVVCDTKAKCNERLLNQYSGTDLGPYDAHRFQETSVPGALPILDLLVGIDVRAPLPNGQAVEFRVEGGFFDAFFIGLTAAYAM